MDFFLTVIFELFFDCEAVRLVQTSDHVQQISLKSSQIVYKND